MFPLLCIYATWLQVVRAGGLDPAVNGDSSHAQSVDTQSANDHAVSDALECLVHILAASKEGHAVALQSGGLSAAAQVLQVSSHLCLARLLTCVDATDLHLTAFCLFNLLQLSVVWAPVLLSASVWQDIQHDFDLRAVVWTSHEFYQSPQCNVLRCRME